MNSLRKKLTLENLLMYGLVIMILMQMLSTFAIIAYKGGGIAPTDLRIYWKGSAYYVRGITLAEAEESPLPEIGVVHVNTIMPWARILGQFLYPGFLPLSVVTVWFWIFFCAALFVFFVQLRKWLSENCEISDKTRLTVFTLGVMFITWFWWDVVIAANPGSLIAILGALAFFYVEKNPNLAALLLAFSLCKPQIGAIFVLAFFLMKFYKVLVKCGVILAISWVLGELYMIFIRNFRGLPPREAGGGLEVVFGLFFERIRSGDGQLDDKVSYLYYGLLDPLRWVGVPLIVVILLSAVAGVAYVIFCYLCLKKTGTKIDPVVMGSATAIASFFWAYKSLCDAVIIALCNAFIISVFLNDEKKDTKKLAMLFAGLILMNCKIVKYFIRFPLHLPHTIGIAGDMVLQILVFTYYFMIYVKRNEASKELTNG